MSNRCVSSVIALAAVGALMLVAPAPVAGQAPAAAGPAWTPPRTPDGQPDIGGYWAGGPGGATHSMEEGCCEPEHRRMQGLGTIRQGAVFRSLIVDPADGKYPYQPWAAAKRRENLVNLFSPTKWDHLEPEDRCLLIGVPRITLRGDLQIIQVPGHVVIRHEWVHAVRVIPLDGRPHADSKVKMFNGDSRGRWEGNTLVVDVTNFNDQTWFDNHGTFHSGDNLHVVERWTFVDPKTIRYEATVEDATVFTQPWKMAFTMVRNADEGFEFLEEACYEGDETSKTLLSSGRAAVAAGITGIHTHEEEQK